MNMKQLAELWSFIPTFTHIFYNTPKKPVNYLWRAHSASQWPFSGTPAVPWHPKLLKQHLRGGLLTRPVRQSDGVTEKQRCGKRQNDGGGKNARKRSRAMKKSQSREKWQEGTVESELHGWLVPKGSAQNSTSPPWTPCSPSITAFPGSCRRLHLNLLRLDVRTDRSPGQ